MSLKQTRGTYIFLGTGQVLSIVQIYPKITVSINDEFFAIPVTKQRCGG